MSISGWRQRITGWVEKLLDAHKALPNAHHTKYTDAEVDTIVAVHTAINGAHHTKYTDAEVDAILAVHSALASVHHTKYTNAEAVAAVAAADDYLLNVGDVIASGGGLSLLNGLLEVRRNVGATTAIMQVSCNATSDVGYFRLENGTSASGLFLPVFVFEGYGYESLAGAVMGVCRGANDVYHADRAVINFQGKKMVGSSSTPLANANIMMVRNYADTLLLVKADGTLDVKNNCIKDQKNHVASALSGTKKVVEILIGATPYYFEVYPTKA